MQNACRVEAQHTSAVALEECRFGRIRQAGDDRLRCVAAHTVDEQVDVLQGFRIRILSVELLQIVLNAHHLSFDIQAGESLFQVHVQLLHHASSFGNAQRREHRETGAR